MVFSDKIKINTEKRNTILKNRASYKDDLIFIILSYKSNGVKLERSKITCCTEEELSVVEGKLLEAEKKSALFYPKIPREAKLKSKLKGFLDNYKGKMGFSSLGTCPDIDDEDSVLADPELVGYGLELVQNGFNWGISTHANIKRMESGLEPNPVCLSGARGYVMTREDLANEVGYTFDESSQMYQSLEDTDKSFSDLNIAVMTVLNDYTDSDGNNYRVDMSLRPEFQLVEQGNTCSLNIFLGEEPLGSNCYSNIGVMNDILSNEFYYALDGTKTDISYRLFGLRNNKIESLVEISTSFNVFQTTTREVQQLHLRN